MQKIVKPALGRIKQLKIVHLVALSILALLALFVFIPKARASSFAIPSSIASDCSTDVTAELLSWIASVPDASTLEFGQDACYRIDGGLKLKSRNNLIIEGNNATFKAVTDGRELGTSAARNRSLWSFSKSSNITFKNMTLHGANPYAGTGDKAYVAALEGQHGISFGGIQGGLIDNVNISDVYGDFVYFGPAYFTNELSRNFIVRNSHFERNGRQGISWTGAEDITVENNFISQVRRSMFDIEPNSTAGHVRRITINKNQLGTHRLSFLANGGASSIVEDITISNNTETGGPMNLAISPSSGRRSRIKIINNVSDVGYGNPAGSVMYFKDTDGIEVSGNTQKIQPDRGMSAVQLYGSTNARIFNNTFINAVTTLRADTSGSGVASSDYLACGNKIVSNEGFTDPTACTPPTVRIDTPLNSAVLSDTAKIVASVNDQIGVKQVEFYVDGILKEADASAPYEFAWDTNSETDNSSHVIKAIVTDAADLSWANEIAVKVNNGLTENWDNVNDFAWPARWTFEGATNEVNLRDIQNNQGRIVESSGATGRVIAYLNSKEAVNTNQTAQFRFSSNIAGFGLMARRSDSDNDTYYYATTVAGAPNNLKIRKVVDGVETNIGYISRPMVSNVDYKMRFEVSPDTDPAKTSLKVKVWEANTAEPSAYNLSKTDAEPKLRGVSGRFGLAYGLGNSRQVWVDNYSAVVSSP